MSNDWFRFREFLIRQERSAMKVGTDGVLLGAWVDCDKRNRIMDVGTGTGLVALMLTQRNHHALITAIEIDPEAANQARENVNASPWADRVEVSQGDFLVWVTADHKFDLIICNPPFFTRSLKNPDIQRSVARHDDGLPLASLMAKSTKLLESSGNLALILPADRVSEALDTASANSLHLHRRTDVRGKVDAPVKRSLLQWGKEPLAPEISELVIETGQRGVYSDEYRRLTEAFYLP